MGKLGDQIIRFLFLEFVLCNKGGLGGWGGGYTGPVSLVEPWEKVCVTNLVHLPPPKVYLATFIINFVGNLSMRINFQLSGNTLTKT